MRERERSSSGIPFWRHFWRHQESPRPQKSPKSSVLSSKIKVSPFSAAVASGSRLGPVWGFILGAFLLQGGSSIASRAPKTAPRRPRDPSRRLLYASRTAPGPPKTPSRPPPARPRRPQGSPRASKTAQGASKAPPRALQTMFLRPQIASKSSPEELSKPPALGLQPLASGLQAASAGCAKR